MEKITYHKGRDYLVPDLYLEKEKYEENYCIGKYGNLRLTYLQNHKRYEYITLFMNKSLRKHIVETDKQANERLETIMKQILEKNPIDESLKDTEPLKWVGLMNNYKNIAEEIIFRELIYV